MLSFRYNPRFQLFWSGFLLLSLGGVLYLFLREPSSNLLANKLFQGSYFFLPKSFNYANLSIKVVVENFPSFCHPCAFIMISSALTSDSTSHIFITTFFWGIINLLFETGQYFNNFIIDIICVYFSKIPFMNLLKGYFEYGTYDFRDIGAITVGTITGYYCSVITLRKILRINNVKGALCS